jgi:hypothetical protein
MALSGWRVLPALPGLVGAVDGLVKFGVGVVVHLGQGLAVSGVNYTE